MCVDFAFGQLRFKLGKATFTFSTKFLEKMARVDQVLAEVHTTAAPVDAAPAYLPAPLLPLPLPSLPPNAAPVDEALAYLAALLLLLCLLQPPAVLPLSSSSIE